jgi:hypothetical protein
MDTDDVPMGQAPSEPTSAFPDAYLAGQKMLDLCFVLDVTGR